MFSTKLSFLLVIGFLPLVGFATDFYKVSSEVTGIYLLEGQVLNVRTRIPKCARGTRCGPSSVATIQVPLGGCVDQLGPVTATRVSSQRGQKVKLFVTAYGVANRRSERIKCAKQPTAVFELSLGRGVYTKEQVEVKFATEFLAD